MDEMSKKELVLPGKNPGLFCDAVLYNGLIFTSGTVARDLEGKVAAPGDVEGQTRHIFDNISKVLEMAGSSLENTLKMTIYLRNMEDRLKINPIRKEYFKASRPASTVVEVSKLAHQDLLVEIEIVAKV